MIEKNEQLFFKFTGLVESFQIYESPVEFNLHNEYLVKITNASGSGGANLRNDSSIEISFSRKISSRNFDALLDLISNFTTKFNDEIHSPIGIFEKGGEKFFIPEMKRLPKGLQSIFENASQKSIDIVKNVIDNHRWRFDGHGKPNPISHINRSFSVDNNEWLPFPRSFEIMAEVINCFHHVRNVEEMNKFIEEHEVPLYHSLYREAYNLKNVNKKAALVIAFISLEMSVKSVIISKVKESSWILINLQSPPVFKLLKEYLPIILGDEEKKVQVSDKMIDTIRNINSIRNNIVHKGIDNDINYSKVMEYLNLIKDVLHIMDYYQGESWALNYITEKSKVEIGLEL